ncbi:MAG: hypothetical protein C0481_09680 [Phenylobacterium sp.]|nr:hypothetical protein [Phenylobacterium sp.]
MPRLRAKQGHIAFCSDGRSARSERRLLRHEVVQSVGDIGVDRCGDPGAASGHVHERPRRVVGRALAGDAAVFEDEAGFRLEFEQSPGVMRRQDRAQRRGVVVGHEWSRHRARGARKAVGPGS